MTIIVIIIIIISISIITSISIIINNSICISISIKFIITITITILILFTMAQNQPFRNIFAMMARLGVCSTVAHSLRKPGGPKALNGQKQLAGKNGGPGKRTTRADGQEQSLLRGATVEGPHLGKPWGR